MAIIVGGATFDRLFAGVRFDEVDGDLLMCTPKNEAAAESGNTFAPHISIVATEILKPKGFQWQGISHQSSPAVDRQSAKGGSLHRTKRAVSASV
jgi:hypothetical protein